jgi:adenosylmethionine-8-amino-7-oxononanoate aminotransferase
MSLPGTNVLYGNLSHQYVTLVRGEGVYVFDDKGRRYLDAIGGVGVVNIGHGVPEVVEAITDQARRLAFSYGGLMDNEPRQALARKLQDWAPPSMGQTKTIFTSGGAEANEAALKLAYQYHWERGNRTKYKVIGRWQSYHGNTIATLSMSGRTSWRRMHTPYLLDFPHVQPPYCYRCPFNLSCSDCGVACAQELRRVIRQEGPEKIAAFIVEPVIGTSMSAVVPPADYYPMVREICDEYDVLLICDEVMSGLGRTGYNWGIDHWGVTPDIITTAKGISGGYVPLAATILSERVWQAIAAGSGHVMHSTTYGGNPLACAAGVATLNYIEAHSLVARAGRMGGLLLERLRELQQESPYIGDVRGLGLFAGLELVLDKATRQVPPPEWNLGERIEIRAMEHGLLVLAGVPGVVDGVAGEHLELVPPYTLDEEHIDFIVATLHRSISEIMAEQLGGR